MRFNFTYFRSTYVKPIIHTIIAKNITDAVYQYNADSNNLSTVVYDDYLQVIDENTWFYNPHLTNTGSFNGCIIANEASSFFNVGIYLDTAKNIQYKNASNSPSLSKLVEDLFSD